jgi:putative transposase
MARPALKRPVVAYIRDHYRVPWRRACRLVRLHRSVLYYRSVKDPRLELRGRMHELARARVRFGYRRLHILLRREGWKLGRNQAYRIYCQEGLQLRSKLPRRRKMVVTRRRRYVPRRPNEAWSMDFVADQLTNGQRFRALTIVDMFSREALAIAVGQRLRAEQVVETCNRLVTERAAPKRIFVDNGSEFSGRLLDLWAYHHGVQIDFSRPGKPTDNCFIETFNGSLRDECLNVHWFESMEEARAKIEAWRQDYNESRPHQALEEQTPQEFAAQARDLGQSTGFQTAGNSL